MYGRDIVAPSGNQTETENTNFTPEALEGLSLLDIIQPMSNSQSLCLPKVCHEGANDNHKVEKSAMLHER